MGDRTLPEFVANYTGIQIKAAHAPSLGDGECVDLVNEETWEVGGDTDGFPNLNAVDFFGKRSAPGGYKWVRNDPNNLTQVPPRGAIMVWGGSAAVGTGPNGHVDIVLDATGEYFNGFDQNWPLGAPAHVVRHSYIGVIGWGYPQFWDDTPLPIVTQKPTEVPPVIVVPRTDMYLFVFDVSPDNPLRPIAAPMPFEDALKGAHGYIAEHPGSTVTISTTVGE